MTLTLHSAAEFALADLTDAYNQARADYLVPMPMGKSQLREYIRIYDVDLDCSVVAMEGTKICGLNMLGVRGDRSWITRCGVIPSKRKSGVGEAMTGYLLDKAVNLEHSYTNLEVICGNSSGLRLFKKMGFSPVNDLLVLGRSPTGAIVKPYEAANWFRSDDAIDLLTQCPTELPWTNQQETFQRGRDARGVWCRLRNGTQGWLVFRRQHNLLSHFIFCTEFGESIELAEALLSLVHARYPDLPAKVENIACGDPHLPAFWKFGYIQKFKRIEMACVHSAKR
jgi:hypothetical protein